ncbi:hypothetical protein C8F01DRAFT_1227190, partial [Mycena amicta]
MSHPSKSSRPTRPASAWNFTRPRLSPFSGFKSDPDSLNNSLVIAVNERVASSRYVGRRNHLFQLWSPNSLQRPFMPGLSAGTAPFPNDPAQRRYDGYNGRFDMTLVPQFINSVPPFAATIRRSDAVFPTDVNFIVHAPLTEYWEPIPGSGLGRISNEGTRLLEAARDRLGSRMTVLSTRAEAIPEASQCFLNDSVQDLFSLLYSASTWDNSFDLFTEIQWHLRRREGWINWVELKLGETVVTSSPYPDARDDLVGVWINGGSEERIRRLLTLSIPCFVIGRVPSDDEETRRREESRALGTFLQGSDTEQRLAQNNTYVRRARLIIPASADLPSSAQVLFASPPGVDDESRRRALSNYRPPPLASTSSTMRRRDNHPSALSPSPSPSPSGPDGFHGEVIEIEGQGDVEEIVRAAYAAADDMSDYGESEVETEERPIDQLVPPTKDKLQPSDPHTTSVYENHAPWIRPPPPIERPFEITNTRWLVHFVPRRLSNGLMAMFEHSRTAGFNDGPSSEHSNLFVDRYNGRILDVGEYVFPPGVVDPATFGLPGPRTYFFEWHGLHGWRATVPTTWMYRSNELCEGQWVGRVPSQPNPGQLPLLSPAMTENQRRSYNLQLHHKPATKKGKEKLRQKRPALHAPASKTNLNDNPSITSLLDLIALDNVFVGMPARDVWNSTEVVEMRRRQHGPRSITRLQSRLIFQFRSQEEERQAWLYFGWLRQLNDARMDTVRPSDFAEVSMFAHDIWDYDREDAAMDYSAELLLVGTSSQAVGASSNSLRIAVPTVQLREQPSPTPPIA